MCAQFLTFPLTGESLNEFSILSSRSSIAHMRPNRANASEAFERFSERPGKERSTLPGCLPQLARPVQPVRRSEARANVKAVPTLPLSEWKIFRGRQLVEAESCDDTRVDFSTADWR
ncbi:MAG: hypothetical protein CMK07_08205 [Ponticaulis sp.]|nr:hypothetical protein [Ponticaulis sp.]